MRIEKFLKSSPLFGIYIAYDRVVRRFQTRLASEGLHFIQALMLTGLFFEDRAVRPSEFAETFGCSRSNISHAIRSLEKKGLIERHLSRQDARAYLITLTKAGRKKAAQLVRIFDVTQSEFEARGGRELSSEISRFVVRRSDVREVRPIG